MAQKILIVDDEPDLLEILAFNLEKMGYEVSRATSGIEALAILDSSISLILLDIMMPGMDGFETAHKIREKGYSMPIIFLTAKDTEGDILRGFELGADDYISKPFSVREVIARVKAVLSRMPTQDEILEFENIRMDTQNKTISVDNQKIILTKTEFLILHTLMSRPGKIYSREELISKAWGRSVYVEERTVDVHITRLRKKLGTTGATIVNRSGYGYELQSKN